MMLKKTFVILLAVVFLFGMSTVVFGASENVNFTNWVVTKNSSDTVTYQGTAKIDRQNKHTGYASLFMSYTYPSSSSNVYIILKQNVSVVQGKTYTYNFYAKANNLKSAQAMISWGADRLNIKTDPAAASNNYNWTKFEKSYTATATATVEFEIKIDNVCDGFWIDDIFFGEQNTTTNLLKNPGFEDGIDITPPQNVTNLQKTDKDTQVALSWTNPADADFSYVNIYQANGAGETVTTSVYSPKNNTVISGLLNGTTYNFILKAVDKDGNESSGVSITAAPIVDAYKTTAYVYKKGSNTIQSLQAGEIEVSATVKNNRMGDHFTGELILALYDGDLMVDISSSGKKVIGQTGELEPFQELKTTITVPPLTNGSYSLHVFLWNEIFGMKTIKTFNVLGTN